MNWRRDRSIRAGRRQANMFSNEVIAMAVKKSTAPKSGTKTAKAKPAVKQAAPKQADAKAKATPNGRRQAGRTQEGAGRQADRAPEEIAGVGGRDQGRGRPGHQGQCQDADRLAREEAREKGEERKRSVPLPHHQARFEALPRAGQFDDELRAELGPAGLIAVSPGGTRAVRSAAATDGSLPGPFTRGNGLIPATICAHLACRSLVHWLSGRLRSHPLPSRPWRFAGLSLRSPRRRGPIPSSARFTSLAGRSKRFLVPGFDLPRPRGNAADRAVKRVRRHICKSGADGHG